MTSLFLYRRNGKRFGRMNAVRYVLQIGTAARARDRQGSENVGSGRYDRDRPAELDSIVIYYKGICRTGQGRIQAFRDHKRYFIRADRFHSAHHAVYRHRNTAELHRKIEAAVERANCYAWHDRLIDPG